MIEKKEFGNKLKGLFSQAKENLQKKENGNTNFVFSKKEFGFYIDEQIKVKLGLGQFGAPAYVPWMGFLGPNQAPQEGIYPVILCYLKQHTIIITYGVSATRKPLISWNNIYDKHGNPASTIGAFFEAKKIEVENPDYNNCFIYSVYSDTLLDEEISDIYDDVNVLLGIYRKTLSILQFNKTSNRLHIIPMLKLLSLKFLPYLAALRTKPFMLLAGISGTGKSRIVREMAKACWKEGDPAFGNNHPRNFCMVQVKPNWHDSSELIGYVSRLNGEKYVVGPFLRFLAAAIKDPEVPYFLCLDEMNLAPVEQYFAEYLSVIESRKLNPDGTITTDPIIEYENTDAYGSLIDQLFDTPEERKTYKTDEGGKRLTIPQNLFVVGTVNMDETTFSFSRKVLDRAMTIEMNEVDLHGGLEKGVGNEIGYIGNSIIGDAAEGCDIYEDNRELCDQVLAYLEQVNNILEGTPFKIAYRTRNEFLMYAVNRKALASDSQLWQTLDEMTSMKILSRIEGDEERTKKVLEGLNALVKEQIVDKIGENADGTLSAEPTARHALPESISAAKIDEMLAKLKATGFTSYWA